MKKHLSLILLLSLVILNACRREITTPPPPTTAPDIDLNLMDPDPLDSMHQDMWELIINEPSGKLLIDTVLRTNTALVATVHTSSLLVNVSCVQYTAIGNYYAAWTYRNVDPRSWTITPSPNFFYTTPYIAPDQWTNVYYTHPPALGPAIANPFDYVWLSDYSTAGGYAPDYQPDNSDYQPGGLLSVYYGRHANDPVYLLFPQLGLYNIHTPPASGNDTVDLTHMDTVAEINYSIPSSYNFLECWANGYFDTTNLLRSVELWDKNAGDSVPADLEYPRTGFQAYWFYLLALSNSGDGFVDYISYDTKIPTSVNWFTAANYNLNANTQDSFSITWNGNKPSYYQTEWQSNNNSFFILSAPDDSTLHPTTWFTNLGSKLLANQTISPLTPSGMYVAQVTGLPSDFNGLCKYYSNPQVTWTPIGTGAAEYELAFSTQTQSTQSFARHHRAKRRILHL